jgi:C-lobe and N-lobe beta barrels of Tf-binding protein B
MRFFSLFALLAATTALGGCPAGDGSALSLATSGAVCGVSAGNCAVPTTVTTPTVTTPVTPTVPPPNVGNANVLTTGDATITLEKSVLVSQKTDPAFSTLVVTSAPNTATMTIDPKSPNKALWPVSTTMNEYVAGTNSSGGLGLGGTYKEYRALTSSSAGSAQDEELQVWNWTYSYGTQYRDVTSGGEATHQAWSFGGTKTAAAAMPTSGSANYVGKFGATAKTWNMIDSTDILQTVSWNNIWRVNGDSSLTANFASGQFDGVLTPKIWNAPDKASINTTVLATNVLDPNYNAFMSNNVILHGTITTNATTGNNVVGTAVLDPAKGSITNSTLNPMYAGFFGPTANEVTGVFNLEATFVAPTGGNIPINNDTRGFIEMSGVFNGQ